MLQVGGFEPFSTTDWPGQLCAVVFVQGCPWRCGYCHNPALQARDLGRRVLGEAGRAERSEGADRPDWAGVRARLRERTGLLDGVVFSGGEPTVDAALPDAIDDARALGFRIGLHTAGIYPRRLEALLPRLDWIGLDLKTDRHRYAALTGAVNAGRAAAQALDLVAASGVPFEVRTTYDPEALPDDAVLAMAAQLREQAVGRWVLQRERRPVAGAAGAWHSVAPPSPALLDRLRGEGLAVECR
ncbi:MAG: anaerobic ribonucleoside-triphosphate reductase activating protein [Burkholderiaceae bacterium]